MNDTQTSSWTGMVPVDDTAVAVTDSRGHGQAILYLNGSYADQKHWRPVINELGAGWRHITYDERARGKSRQSADYSFAACLRDIDAVLATTGVNRPILVGWSYGAALAVHWADRHPDRVAAVVSVDGALPYGLTGEEGRERIRTLFRRMRWFFPVASRLGLAARMTADQHADINIELNELSAVLAPVLERLACPVRFVLGSGGNLGGGAEEMEAARACLNPVLARNPNIKVTAKVASNHSRIVRTDYRVIADAIRAAAGPPKTSSRGGS